MGVAVHSGHAGHDSGREPDRERQPTNNHIRWMTHALGEAELAAADDEVPVGAVLVADNRVIATGRNRTRMWNDPTAHAEIVLLREAATKLANYRLVDTTLYVTVEPCTMCAGALVHARVSRLVYGAHEPKSGAVISTAAVLDNPRLNHRVAVTGGVLADRSSAMMANFFRRRRAERQRDT